MLRWVKNHFIPHHGNDHHPHLLRARAIGVLLGIAVGAELVFLLAAFVVLPQTGFLARIAPDVLVQSANASRREVSRSSLAPSATLERAAQLKANDMATKGYFAHTSPEGVTPWYWLDAAGYHYVSAGENLAVNFVDSSDVHHAWMNSPTHRANILNAGYTEIGIASATGTYQGAEAIFVVQFFGKPQVRQPHAVSVAQVSAATPIPPASVTPTPTVLPAHVAEAPIVAQVVAAPRKTASAFFTIIGALVILALALTLVIRLRVPHPRIALLPALLIVVLFVLTLFNEQLTLAGLHIL